MLTDDELARWRRDGCLVVTDALLPQQRSDLSTWANAVRSWTPRASDDNPLLHQVVDGDVVTTENVADHHDAIGSLLRSGPLPTIAARLLGEEVTLHSDALRFQGADGAPRQLGSGARYVDRHLGCVVAIDALEGPAIEVARGRHSRRLAADRFGRLASVDAAGLPWEPIDVDAGSILWLHRWAPFRSSTRDLRSFEVTYSARAQGDLRAAFYVMRRREVERSVEGVIDDADGR